MSVKPLRVGVIGVGYWGPNIIRNLTEFTDARVSVICDKDAARLGVLTHRYPYVKITRNFHDVLRDPLIDAVAIATPVSSHYAMAREALLSGKHVFVEKPLARRGSEARELTQLARRRGLTLMVDHIFLYSSPIQKIKRLVSSGHLGEIYYFDSVRINLGLFQRDVNVLWDLAPHDLSIMDHLLDRKPLSISATAMKHIRGSGKEDIAYLTIRYSNQLIAHIHVNWLAPAKIRQILIGGARRMLVYDDANPSEKIRVYDKRVALVRNVQRQVEYRLGDMWAPHLNSREALHQALKHFITCIRERRRPLSDGVAGTRVVEFLEAASRSAEARGKEIQL